MIQQANELEVPIVIKYVNKGTKQAQKDLTALDRLAGKLGKTVAATFAATKIAQFGKASVQAFLADDKAAKQLTMTLINLGKASQTTGVADFIQKLQDQTGVLDDQLRPAMQTLLVQTRDVTQAQDLLTLALDVSQGSGKGLQQTAVALGRAYNGNLTALAKLDVGITKASAKTITFGQATQKLTYLWGGAAKMAAETYAGKVNLLKAAFSNLQESIGKGIIVGLQALVQSGSINTLTTQMNNFGQEVQYAIIGVGELIGKLSKKTKSATGMSASDFVGLIPVIGGWFGPGGIFEKLAEAGKKSKTLAKQNAAEQKILEEYAKRQKKYAADQAKLEASIAASAKATAQAKKESALLDKASAILKGAQDIFDPDRIELAAAMTQKLTQEEYARLKVKKDIFDLEDAIASGSVAAAAQVSQTLVNDAERLAKLQGIANGFTNINNPFLQWLSSIEEMNKALQESYRLMQMMTSYLWNMSPTYGTSRNDTYGGIIPDYVEPGTVGYVGSQLMRVMPDGSYVPMANGGIVTQATPILAGEAGPEAIIPLDKFDSFGGGNITVNVAGSVVTQQQLIDAISTGLQNKGASGIPTSFSRVNSPYIA